MEAGTLNCPECGAAVATDSPQCQYCHALLQTVACPHCMGMMFAGTKFCPHCGVPVQSVLQGANTHRQCPQCKVSLVDVQLVNTPLDECPQCGGLWVDVASFEFICSNTEAQSAATGLKLPPPVAVDPHVRYRPCPECGKLMSRTNYATRSGIVIDVCRMHGIWLDRNEICQVIAFVRSGGLDRARQVEKEELAEARRNIAFQPDEGTALGGSLLRNCLTSDDSAHLLRGVASLANHFLGDS